jgi:hypothetical protein
VSWPYRVASSRPPRVRRASAAALGLSAFVLAVIGGPAGAHEPPGLTEPGADAIADAVADVDQDAAPDPGANGSVRLTVTELTGVLGPGTRPAPDDGTPATSEAPDELRLRVVVENDGDLPLEGLRLVVEVHPPALTRGVLRQALEGDVRSEPSNVRTSPELLEGETLEAGGVAGVATEFDPGDVLWSDGPGGVHPVTIAVTRGTTTLDEVATAVVWLNETPSTPMLATLVWPLDASPWRTTGGDYPASVGREIRPGGRLDTLLAVAERAPGAPIVLAPAAHLLEDLSDRSDGFEALIRREAGALESRTVAASDPEATLARQTLRRLRELTSNQVHAPISGTYANADLGALASGNTATLDLAGMAAIEGRRRVQGQLGVPVDAGVHLVSGPISPSVLDLLPGDTVVLPSRAAGLAELIGDPPLDEPVRTVRASSGRLLTALIADPYLEAGFEAVGQAGPFVTAQRTVAESAMAYLVAPDDPDRGLVLLPPRTWQPSPTTATAVLRGLTNAPWIELGSPARLASEARSSRSPVVLAPSDDGPLEDELVASLTSARAGLESLEAALPSANTRIEGRSLEMLEDDLMRASSRWYRGDATGQAEALVRDVQRTVDTTLGEVEVTSGTVTLTSDTGQIPVTLQRSRGDAVQVVVTVESQGRLLWPEGRRSEVLDLEEDSSQTVSFPTRALSTGTFPVTVRVTDPSGITVIAGTTLSVRSTAISGVALTGTVLLVVVLLLFGAVRRRSSPRPGVLTSVEGG